MAWLNYNHLYYFWIAAREGGVTRASESLHVSQPSISRQIRELESSVGEKLFEKSGRGLALTEVGRVAFEYAEEIFGLGREMLEAIERGVDPKRMRVTIGIADSVPKLIAYRLLRPLFELQPAVRVVIREDDPPTLLAELALCALDLVLSDAPIGAHAKVRGFSHLLGESDVSLYCRERDAKRYVRDFPRSLDGAPMLLPAEGTDLRRSVDQWLDRRNIEPRIVGEFEDNALMKAVAYEGVGVFPGENVIAKELHRQYGVVPIGSLPGVRVRFYAISPERKLEHPAVIHLTEAARQELFR